LGQGRSKGLRDGLYLFRGYIKGLIELALREDIGGGDITTSAIIDKKARGSAEIIAKEGLVVAGLPMAEMVFKALDKGVRFKPLVKDGDRVKKGQILARVEGRLFPLLTGERVALNFLQRLSGIATLTRRFVDKVKGHPVKILDTRKTTPGLRVLEKYAVRTGGGYNHRFGLYDGILIKDNHIKIAGNVMEAICRVREKEDVKVKEVMVEVEVKNIKEVRETIMGGADIIMLDNMGLKKVRRAIKLIKGKALIEVSGGISLKNVREIAKTGVDFISIGYLTHSARAVDISLEINE